MKKYIALILVLVPWMMAPFDPTLCDNDNQTEVPPFAMDRDGNQCLRIDPGNGDPPILFQFEEMHKRGVAESSGGVVAGIDKVRDQFKAEGAYTSQCSQTNVGCRFLLWDNTIDAYLSNQAGAEDLLKILANTKYTYLKDMRIWNGWRCNVGSTSTPGTTTWNGPNGISCPASQTSSAHMDGVQTNYVPQEGGWIIFQDSSLINGGNAQMIMSDKPSTPGGMLFQGFQSGRYNTPVGEAEHWIDDCEASFHSAAICNNQVNAANMRIGARLTALWLVDSWGNTPFSDLPDLLKDKVIVINSGCNQNGCFRDAFNPTPNGSRAYLNGWPVPLKIPSTAGPGTCPNGLIATNPTSNVAKVYCYTSLENALADNSCSGCPHVRAPFLQHSNAGWQTPPSGAVCGDGDVSGGELCDKGGSPPPPAENLNGKACTDPQFGTFTGGELDCNATCTGFVTTGCTGATVCGNDTVEGGEECDDGTDNADTARCLPTTCRWAKYGDGKVCTSVHAEFGCAQSPSLDAVEACDDSNTNNTTDACRSPGVAATCGDSLVCSDAACDPTPGLEDCDSSDTPCAPGTCSSCQCVGGGTPGPAAGTLDLIDAGGADTAIDTFSPLAQSGAVINRTLLELDDPACLNLHYVFGSGTESVGCTCVGWEPTICESSPPLALGGDTGGNFNCWSYLATEGAKSCTCTPYAANGCTGTAGSPVTWDFLMQTLKANRIQGSGVRFK